MLKRKTIFVTFIALIFIALGFSGCGGKSAGEGSGAKPSGVETLTESALEAPQDKIDIKFPLGLYINFGNGTRDLQTQVITDFSVGSDLVVLSAFATTEPAISGSKFGGVWDSYWDAIPQLASYKIGYCVSYALSSGESITQMIFGPADTQANREYLETYIYDDVHQSGWYSHLLTTDMTEETAITSVKLTGGANVSDVSEVKLEAFLYKADDTSDIAGSYTVGVERK